MAADSTRLRPIVSGASAARWSGPVRVCRHPATEACPGCLDYMDPLVGGVQGLEGGGCAVGVRCGGRAAMCERSEGAEQAGGCQGYRHCHQPREHLLGMADKQEWQE